MATSATEVPAPKHHKSGLGLEPSYEKQWDSVIQLQSLQQKTPHRYQQSPVFARKSTSCPTEEFEHGRHRHTRHHHHRRHHHENHRPHRRRGNSEGDKTNVPSDERVHLLSELPWRKSGDFSSSSDSSSNNSVEEGKLSISPERFNVGTFSPSFSRRFDHRGHVERERTRSVSSAQAPLFLRRGKQRARSQGCSPLPVRKTYHHATIMPQGYSESQQPRVLYTGSLMIDIQPITDSHIINILSPEEPETPQPGSDGFLPVPTLEVTSAPSSSSPHMRRFLGLETNINHKEGLSEEEISNSRLMSRRFSSSSDSSTSTLT